ncbi:monocarboxylate transporter 9 isoform X1 [Biomphalaria glabrata]|nr:monocarboxylate transporter 9 isoform X1 [Biomphalaria glabrata]
MMKGKMNTSITQVTTNKGNNSNFKKENCEKNAGSRKSGVNVLVLDSAHSWLICLGNFVILTLTASFSRLNHMTFLDIVQKFDVSITAASIGFTLQLVSLSIFSTLVTSLIVPATGERLSGLIASCISCLTIFGIGHSPNIAVYLLCMTVKGACIAVTNVPSIALISKYFDKRKSLATALACSGMAVGSMGAPPLVEIMLQNYGLQWTYILMAALELNAIWAAMLLRPTSRYNKVMTNEEYRQIKSVQAEETPENLAIELHPLNEPPADDSKNPNESARDEPEIPKNSHKYVDKDYDFQYVENINGTIFNFDKETQLDKDLKPQTFSTVFNESSKIPTMEDFIIPNLIQIDPNLNIQNATVEEHNLHNSTKKSFTESAKLNSEICEINGTFGLTDESVHGNTESSTKTPKAGSRVKAALCSLSMGIYHAFNLQLLKTWSMRCLLFYCASGIIIMYVPAYMPTIAIKNQMSPDQVSLLLIAAGAVDFVGRIAIGAFADMKILTACQIVAISQLILGTICQFAVYYNTFGTLMFLSVSSGLFTGSRTGLASIVCYEFMGAQNLLKSFGVQTMLGTLSMGLHHPLLSSILEATDSFAYPLHYVGAATYVSAIFILLQPIANRHDKRRAALKQEQQPT